MNARSVEMYGGKVNETSTAIVVLTEPGKQRLKQVPVYLQRYDRSSVRRTYLVHY